MEQEELEVYNTLVTRAKTYFVQESSEPTQPTIPAKRSKRNTAYIKCSVHNPPTKKNDTWAVEIQIVLRVLCSIQTVHFQMEFFQRDDQSLNS